MDLHRIHSHKYFRGGKVQKSFLLGFCIFASVLFSVIWYRTFYVINDVEFTVWKTYKGCYITPYKYWGEKIKSLNHDSLYYADAKVDIFKMGDNPIVDHEVFKKNGQRVSNKQYPYQYVYGNKLKKYPDSYQDVRDLVLADYQEEIEKEWVKQLRKLYSVKIYENVLSTVNNHE